MTDFETLCRVRRSIRKYTEQKVEREKLDYILRCALMSPSGKRTNPWEFYVVTDTEKLRQMAGCRTYGSGMFETAQAAIVVALDASLTDTWQSDGAIAATVCKFICFVHTTCQHPSSPSFGGVGEVTQCTF